MQSCCRWHWRWRWRRLSLFLPFCLLTERWPSSIAQDPPCPAPPIHKLTSFRRKPSSSTALLASSYRPLASRRHSFLRSRAPSLQLTATLQPATAAAVAPSPATATAIRQRPSSPLRLLGRLLGGRRGACAPQCVPHPGTHHTIHRVHASGFTASRRGTRTYFFCILLHSRRRGRLAPLRRPRHGGGGERSPTTCPSSRPSFLVVRAHLGLASPSPNSRRPHRRIRLPMPPLVHRWWRFPPPLTLPYLRPPIIPPCTHPHKHNTT